MRQEVLRLIRWRISSKWQRDRRSHGQQYKKKRGLSSRTAPAAKFTDASDLSIRRAIACGMSEISARIFVCLFASSTALKPFGYGEFGYKIVGVAAIG